MPCYEANWCTGLNTVTHCQQWKHNNSVCLIVLHIPFLAVRTAVKKDWFNYCFFCSNHDASCLVLIPSQLVTILQSSLVFAIKYPIILTIHCHCSCKHELWVQSTKKKRRGNYHCRNWRADWPHQSEAVTWYISLTSPKQLRANVRTNHSSCNLEICLHFTLL